MNLEPDAKEHAYSNGRNVSDSKRSSPEERAKLFLSELQSDAKRVDTFYLRMQSTLQQHLETLKQSTNLLEHERDDDEGIAEQNLKISFTRLFRKLHNLLSFGTLNQTGPMFHH